MSILIKLRNLDVLLNAFYTVYKIYCATNSHTAYYFLFKIIAIQLIIQIFPCPGVPCTSTFLAMDAA